MYYNFSNGKVETLLISEVSIFPEYSSVISVHNIISLLKKKKKKQSKTTAARTTTLLELSHCKCLYFAENLLMNHYSF